MPALKDDLHLSRDTDLIEGSQLLGEAEYATVNSVRSNFAKIIDLSNNDGKKILITEHKRPAAAVVPVSDLRVLMLLEKLGITQQLKDLTYEDISVDEAIDSLTRMSKAAKDRPSGTTSSDGDSQSATKRQRHSSKSKAA